ncbi:rab-GTPase-TBC domain-containing protein [Mucor mucedo]|uniref:rab-GTPase-TBC domain-containing protein n=1 Tax=Mucor mucedo TaxID=29922 RepID=UPI00221E94D2|nr:rab-GTPase-TBC domain-containing protein [Mucor mucedo]KAI7876499.1 rab-GTPase-TBC domain-containing protein [Mucor mucedo]
MAITNGLPSSSRGLIWLAFCKPEGGFESIEKVYHDLLQQLSPYEDEIKKDLHRSFPTIEYFKNINGEGQQRLFNVLKAYSLYEPEVGYCQGLNFVVGILLLHLSDEEAFCVLTSLMKQAEFRTQFDCDLSGLNIRIFQFGQLMIHYTKGLHIHFKLQRMNTKMFITPWFLGMFGNQSNIKVVYRIFDLVLLEGTNFLFNVGLALLTKNWAQLRILSRPELANLLLRDVANAYQVTLDFFIRNMSNNYFN